MYPFQGAQPATRLVCEVLLAMAMLSRQVPIVKRASSPVVPWATRAGTPAPHFWLSNVMVPGAGCTAIFYILTFFPPANGDVPLTDPHCKTGVLARCPLGYAGGDARATFFACRTSWFLEPAAQQSSTFFHCCRPLMAMFS